MHHRIKQSTILIRNGMSLSASRHSICHVEKKRLSIARWDEYPNSRRYMYRYLNTYALFGLGIKRRRRRVVHFSRVCLAAFSILDISGIVSETQSSPYLPDRYSRSVHEDFSSYFNGFMTIHSHLGRLTARTHKLWWSWLQQLGCQRIIQHVHHCVLGTSDIRTTSCSGIDSVERVTGWHLSLTLSL
jgi:hypothetical protein